MGRVSVLPFCRLPFYRFFLQNLWGGPRTPTPLPNQHSFGDPPSPPTTRGNQFFPGAGSRKNGAQGHLYLKPWQANLHIISVFSTLTVMTESDPVSGGIGSGTTKPFGVIVTVRNIRNECKRKAKVLGRSIKLHELGLTRTGELFEFQVPHFIAQARHIILAHTVWTFPSAENRIPEPGFLHHHRKAWPPSSFTWVWQDHLYTRAWWLEVCALGFLGPKWLYSREKKPMLLVNWGSPQERQPELWNAGCPSWTLPHAIWRGWNFGVRPRPHGCGHQEASGMMGLGSFHERLTCWVGLGSFATARFFAVHQKGQGLIQRLAIPSLSGSIKVSLQVTTGVANAHIPADLAAWSAVGGVFRTCQLCRLRQGLTWRKPKAQCVRLAFLPRTPLWSLVSQKRAHAPHALDTSQWVSSLSPHGQSYMVVVGNHFTFLLVA